MGVVDLLLQSKVCKLKRKKKEKKENKHTQKTKQNVAKLKGSENFTNTLLTAS